MSQVPEQPYTLAGFRNTFRERYKFTNVTVLGSDANGTHFFYDDALGERHFGVISDLTGFHIDRVGTVSLSIVNGQAVSSDETISPSLEGDLADWRAFTSHRGIIQRCMTRASIISATVLRVGVTSFNIAHLSLSSDAVGPTDSVDVLITNPHDHQLTLDPHSHTGGGHGNVTATIVVDWLLIHV